MSSIRTFRPIFGRVLVRADTIEDKIQQFKALKQMGFKIPDQAKENEVPTIGTIVSVGHTADPVLKVGMRVLYGRYAAKRIEWDLSLNVLQDEDILGIVEDDLQPEEHGGQAL